MEFLDIIDEKNNLTGKKENVENVFKKGLWHREVSIFVLNEKGEVLIQKRPESKKRKPNMWTICSGCVFEDEDVIAAAIRKLKEELVINVTINDLELIEIVIEQENNKDDINNNFRYIYFLKTKRKLEEYNINPNEASEIKYIPLSEMKEIIEKRYANYTFIKQDYMEIVIQQLKKNLIR